MPELPEVEVVARVLAPHLQDRSIQSVQVRDPKLVPMLSDWTVLQGSRIDAVRRIGKQVAFSLTSPTGRQLLLSVHLRMTGRLIFSAQAPDPTVKHLRLVVRLDRGWLVFQDPRRFGTIKFCDHPDSILKGAIDPLARGFTAAKLAALIGTSMTPIKVWLLRQDRLVGIGNIYASESLFLAGIHPMRPASRIKPKELERLHTAIKHVLRRSIAAGGTTFSDFRDGNGHVGNYTRKLKVYDRAGEPCDKCDMLIEKLVQAQRSTFFCPKCQK